jgi:hypothetical protein
MVGGFVEARKLSRIGVHWPVIIVTDEGPVMGEVRNITMKGMFIHCGERLSANDTYRFLIKPPGEEIAIMGKLLWSNLESAAGRDSLKGMGFSFVKVNEVHEELLREAIQKYVEK